MHRPSFIPDTTELYKFFCTSQETQLHFRYEPKRLILSIGLWRWYINITITILDIIRRRVFYLKLSTTLQGCLYLTGNTITSPLRAQQVNAIYRFVMMVY
jgi:hypothetical protein